MHLEHFFSRMRFRQNDTLLIQRIKNVSIMFSSGYLRSFFIYLSILISSAPSLANSEDCLHLNNNINNQIRNCEQLLKINKNSTQADFNIRLKLLALYTHQGSYENAHKLFASMTHYSADTLTYQQNFNLQRRLGILYYREGLFPKSLLFFKKAAALIKSDIHEAMFAKIQADIGTAYLAMAKYSQAILAYNKSLKIKKN